MMFVELNIGQQLVVDDYAVESYRRHYCFHFVDTVANAVVLLVIVALDNGVNALLVAWAIVSPMVAVDGFVAVSHNVVAALNVLNVDAVMLVHQVLPKKSSKKKKLIL